jgi:hypothetical protein
MRVRFFSLLRLLLAHLAAGEGRGQCSSVQAAMQCASDASLALHLHHLPSITTGTMQVVRLALGLQ